VTLLPFAREKPRERHKRGRRPEIARFHANTNGVAVCETCLEPHKRATALAPWSNVPRCRHMACNGLLIFPDTVKGTAK